MWGNEQDFRCRSLMPIIYDAPSSWLRPKLGGVVKLLKCDCEGRDASRLYTWDVNHIGVFCCLADESSVLSASPPHWEQTTPEEMGPNLL